MRERGLTIVDGILYHADAEVCTWVNMNLGVGIVPKQAYAFGVLRDGWDDTMVKLEQIPEMLAAGVYFYDHFDAEEDGYSDVSCTAYVSEPRFITPSIVRRIVHYPFNQLGVRRITAQIDEANIRALDQATRLGFVVEGCKRFMAPDNGNVLILGLYPDQVAQWLRSETVH